MFMLVPNIFLVDCTILEEFRQPFQENIANIEISNEHSALGSFERQGRQFQDDAFVAPNLNPFNAQPQTPQPQFRDIPGGGGGFGGFANQQQSVSMV